MREAENGDTRMLQVSEAQGRAGFREEGLFLNKRDFPFSEMESGCEDSIHA